MKKRFFGISAVLLSIVIVFSATDIVAPASEASSGVYYNHGTIMISSSYASEDHIIAFEKVGDNTLIKITPYAHMQWQGCGASYCPDDCEVGCFTAGAGCVCYLYSVLRLATVTVDIEDENVVTAGKSYPEGDLGALTSVTQMMNGYVSLLAVGEGITTVTVTAALCDWLPASVTYTVGVGYDASELPAPEQPSDTETDSGDTSQTGCSSCESGLCCDQECSSCDSSSCCGQGCSSCGGAECSCEIAVDGAAHVEGIEIDAASAELATGSTLQLSATVMPADAANRNVVWTSSDESVATVDENGAVTALAYGTAVITATTEDGGYTATCTIRTRFNDVVMTTDAAGGTSYGDASNLTAYNAICWAADNNITRGYSEDGTFRPTAEVTREEMAIFLWRLAGRPSANDGTADFTDAANIKSSAGRKAIAWAAENGIVHGYSDGTFKPGSSVTREEIAISLYRLARLQNRDDTNAGDETVFMDESEIKSSGGRKAIAWAAKEGIVKGCSGDRAGCFGPQDSCLRQQLVIMLMRYAGEA